VRGSLAVSGNRVLREELGNLRIFHKIDLGHLVGNLEPVEKVDAGKPRAERGNVRDQRQVVRVLHAARTQHQRTGPPR
jgi:hypothetical protein